MASPQEFPKCSHCINATLQASRRRGRLDEFMERLGFRPMRCRSCNRRVYIRASLIPEKKRSTPFAQQPED